ncbi:putative proton-dependent oligopeptide transporter family [Helianthus anomalus]
MGLWDSFDSSICPTKHFSLHQAKTMNRSLTKSFQIPAGSMTVFTLTSMLMTIVFYDRIFVPITHKITGVEQGMTFLTRMGIGFAISVLTALVARFVEIKHKKPFLTMV